MTLNADVVVLDAVVIVAVGNNRLWLILILITSANIISNVFEMVVVLVAVGVLSLWWLVLTNMGAAVGLVCLKTWAKVSKNKQTQITPNAKLGEHNKPQAKTNTSEKRTPRPGNTQARTSENEAQTQANTNENTNKTQANTKG